MAIVAGADFGTLSVRVSIVDSERGRLGAAAEEYPLHRKRGDPDYATQSHDDHMRALAAATRKATRDAGIDSAEVEAIALDTTGTTMVPVDRNMRPLDDYYLWCDHRAKREASEITSLAHREKLEAINWCGGVYSHEWGFAKLLHWLRNNPDKRSKFSSAFEHCDMVAATLCGIGDPKQVKRSVCAMGHKWMWSREVGRSAAAVVSFQGRSASGRDTGKAQQRVSYFGSCGRTSGSRLGRSSGPACRHSRAGGRL